MCLAIPMRLLEINGTTGSVEEAGVRRAVGLDLIADPRPGDDYLIHAGFAISRVETAEARETLALFDAIAAAATELPVPVRTDD